MAALHFKRPLGAAGSAGRTHSWPASSGICRPLVSSPPPSRPEVRLSFTGNTKLQTVPGRVEHQAILISLKSRTPPSQSQWGPPREGHFSPQLSVTSVVRRLAMDECTELRCMLTAHCLCHCLSWYIHRPHPEVCKLLCQSCTLHVCHLSGICVISCPKCVPVFYFYFYKPRISFRLHKPCQKIKTLFFSYEAAQALI
jgi:hypothetical protein